MLRIAGSDVDPNANGTGKAGFRVGTPGVNASTEITAAWLNQLQESVVQTIELAGLTPSSDATQMAVAIGTIASGYAASALSDAQDAFERRLKRMAIANARAIPGVHTSSALAMCSLSTPSAPTSTGYLVVGGLGSISQMGNGMLGAVARTAPASFSGNYFGVCLGTPTGGVSTGTAVAVGAAGTLHSSTFVSGYATWAAATPAAGYSNDFTDVCFGADTFCAVGLAAEIETSTTGTSGWTKRTPGSSFSGALYSCCHTGSAFVVGGASGELQRSTNLTTWTRVVPSPSTTSSFTLVRSDGAGHVVAITSSGLVYESNDHGVNFTLSAPSGGIGVSPLSVAYIPLLGTWAATVGSDYSIWWRNPQSYTWERGGYMPAPGARIIGDPSTASTASWVGCASNGVLLAGLDV